MKRNIWCTLENSSACAFDARARRGLQRVQAHRQREVLSINKDADPKPDKADRHKAVLQA
jgi:hypothetical protein